MKKIINYLKGLIRIFFPRPKLTEVYIISTRYQHIEPVVEFLEKRKQWCEKEGVEFRLHYFPFLNTQKCGELILYLNDEKMGSNRLFVDNGIVCLKSYE